MAAYTAVIDWEFSGSGFAQGRYPRGHTWEFDGGAKVPASASPLHVPAPWSVPAGVDPEEAYVAAIASCHMLIFLYLASRRGLTVQRYRDRAEGGMERNEAGRQWIAQVTLHPEIEFSGEQPTADEVRRLHHEAHAECYVANSVRTRIIVADTP